MIGTFLMTYPMNGPRQRKSDPMEMVFLLHRKRYISENMHDGSSLNVPDWHGMCAPLCAPSWNSIPSQSAILLRLCLSALVNPYPIRRLIGRRLFVGVFSHDFRFFRVVCGFDGHIILPKIAHPILFPECPVIRLSSKGPRPKSSSSSCTMIERPHRSFTDTFAK